MEIDYNIQNIKDIAFEILSFISKKKNNNRATIVFLIGDLGAGKTTLTQEICKHLNIKDKVASPTFVIMNEYQIDDNHDFNLLFDFKQFIHIDAYRVDESFNVDVLNLREYIKNKNNLIFIEWPYNLKNIENDIVLSLSFKDENTRHLSLL